MCDVEGVIVIGEDIASNAALARVESWMGESLELIYRTRFVANLVLWMRRIR